jgi:superfamily II DNA or RNA helicase
MFRLQAHQESVLNYLNHVNRILLFHGLGSGKTCTSIALALAKYQNNPIVVITPASLVSNFMNELRGECGNHVRGRYKLDDIETRFRVVSKDKMYHDYKDRLETLCNELKNTVIVFDEVHRLLSYNKDAKEYTFFQKLLNCVKESSKCVFLSATPITDPYKIVPLARFLLTPNEFKISTLARVHTARMFFVRYSDRRDLIQNEQELIDLFRNRVSYYQATSNHYPRVIHHEMYCYIEKGTVQENVYRNAMGMNPMLLPNNHRNITQEFLLSARKASNMVQGAHVRDRAVLKERGIKFHTCLESIVRRKGPFFVYSNFVTESGIDAFAEYLEHLYHYSNANDLVVPYRSYAILRANDPNRHAILERFNRMENRDGRDINIIIGSPSSAEGITLKRLREIHILDPHWTPTVTDQIIARGVRYKSHDQVNYNTVHVFHYYAVPREPTLLSVDLHIKKMQIDKKRWLSMFESVLKKAAIENQPSTSRRQQAPVTVLTNNNNNTRNNRQSSNNNNINNQQRPLKRIRRITKLSAYNPRLLNRYMKKTKKKIVINLTKENHNNVVNLT